MTRARTFKKRVTKLARGVLVSGRLLRMLPVDEDGEVWRVFVFKASEGCGKEQRYELAAVYEGTLHKVRKQTCARYPSACKVFGGARAYGIFR